MEEGTIATELIQRIDHKSSAAKLQMIENQISLLNTMITNYMYNELCLKCLSFYIVYLDDLEELKLQVTQMNVSTLHGIVRHPIG